MEDTVLDIVDLLDSSTLNDVIHGIDQLDLLLSQLLPQIKTLHKNKDKEASEPDTYGEIRSLATFIALQDNFQYNIAHNLLNFYKFVLREEVDTESILACNRLLQGLLLIHPASRKLFNRSANMKLILSLVESPKNSIQITVSYISTLIHILLKDLKNFRVFEDNNGCSILIRKFKLSSFDELPPKSSSASKVYNQQNLNFKIIEFLIFYLIDETNFKSTITPKSVQEKSALFKADFPEIDSLIENLNELNNL